MSSVYRHGRMEQAERTIRQSLRWFCSWLHFSCLSVQQEKAQTINKQEIKSLFYGNFPPLNDLPKGGEDGCISMPFVLLSKPKSRKEKAIWFVSRYHS